ncbi:MAG: class I SAM-dependent methyltransferase, partial [Ignavibacteria bacterium]
SLDKSINEINRVLKRNGKLIVVEFFKNTKRLRQKILNNAKKLISKTGNLISKSPYAYDYFFESINNFLTLTEFVELLTQSGFKSEFVKKYFFGFVHTVIASKK